MKKRPFVPPVLLFLALLLAACASKPANNAAIKMEGMRFTPGEVQVQAGQPVTLRLVNKDGYAHAFDIDAFDVHSPLAAKETKIITFTPEEPGRYAYYCSSPGHQTAGMVGTLIINP